MMIILVMVWQDVVGVENTSFKLKILCWPLVKEKCRNCLRSQNTPKLHGFHTFMHITAQKKNYTISAFFIVAGSQSVFNIHAERATCLLTLITFHTQTFYILVGIPFPHHHILNYEYYGDWHTFLIQSHLFSCIHLSINMSPLVWY